ncbi:Copia protein (Gag-int-pol protein), partial [Daphnia magna]
PPIEGRNVRFADSNGSSRKRGRCNNCGRPGHWADDCWDDPYDEPYNPSWKPKEPSSANVNLSWRKGKPAKEDTAKVASHHIPSTTEFLLDSGATRNI